MGLRSPIGILLIFDGISVFVKPLKQSVDTKMVVFNKMS